MCWKIMIELILSLQKCDTVNRYVIANNRLMNLDNNRNSIIVFSNSNIISIVRSERISEMGMSLNFKVHVLYNL